MFNLSRYFSTVSFILIVLAAGILGPLYRHLSLSQMKLLAEHRNVAMSQVIENSLRRPLDNLMDESIGRDADFARQSADGDRLRSSVVDLMRNTAMIRINIFNRLGATVFATDVSTVDEDHLGQSGFRRAMSGRVSSELTHMPSMDTFDGKRLERDVLVSYVPLRGDDKAVVGVFELYQDVTPFVNQLGRTLWWVTGGVFAVFAGLYLMQYLVVRRAQRILEEQEGRLKAARDTLEIQVEARTEELKRANRQLQDEIAERRQAESKLNYLAYHDPLTGLANRRSFIERLEDSLHEAEHLAQRIAVLFIDLDQFKQVNDSLGHGIGDQLLVAVAARLSERVRLIDLLARLGGDEFICLMEVARDKTEVVMLAREITSAFEEPFQIDEHQLYLSSSIGVCLYPGDGSSVVELLRNADTAMYRAKGSGRGQFQFYTPEMTEDAQARIRMENLMRGALGKGEFVVHLQPQVDAHSGRLVGAEALVRWNSPELGLVMPAQFIPLAEDSGLIIGLGAWILRETCAQFVQWRQSGFQLPQVSVNLSVRQLERPEFIDTLGDILDETGMDAACLKLELTESVVMAVGEACSLLQRLRDFGISLALDDFGTGYSSLSYLKMLPVQQLKIDRSFVMGIGRNPGDEAIIRTIMELANSLGFEVVAEGVETAEQADFLAALGCQQLQGFLHGKAVPAAEFLALWSVHR